MLLVAAPARAEVRFTLEYQSGARMPLGYYGFAIDVQPVTWLSLDAGLGFYNHQGSSQVQLALAPRLRWPVGSMMLVNWGAAVSWGERRDTAPGPYEPDRAPTFRVGPEAGLELILGPRGRLRLFGGVSVGLQENHPVDPYLGVAAGLTVLPRPPEATQRHWYGWQTLATDGAAMTLFIASNPNRQGSGEGFVYAAGKQTVIVYLGGAPAVHAAHGKLGTAVGSFALRAGLALGLRLLAAGTDTAECVRFQCKGASAMLVGGLMASVLDAAWLAWEP